MPECLGMASIQLNPLPCTAMLSTGLSSFLRQACMGVLLPAMFMSLGGAAIPLPAYAYPQASPLTGPGARAVINEVLAAPAFSSSVSASAGLALFGVLAGLAALTLVVRAQAGTLVANPLATASFSALPAPEVDTLALSQAQALWPQAPVQAVTRLYEGLLARLQSDYHVRIDSADTEADILARVAALRLSGLEDFSQRLIRHWLQARYTGSAPPEPTWVSLCEGWHRLFPTDDIA